MASTARISVRNFCPDAGGPRGERRIRSGSEQNGLFRPPVSQRLSGTPEVVPCRWNKTPERTA
ncbi:hypothetical protein [Lentzea flaviverrucosa]|uniref:Uncharacterized protein n=1 Tax=Lentzea flaviverrucosa TaxID=200379 RepID=A0A1H9BDN5_9PSEU|nr:hypothetical protein [Lentzea flaviverrucosa]RDI31804.1 hypothetical protein DFR72_103204 [Lentzea flaviverrucosa]SEP87130.1 hypothetical protein SAMN05216195_101454 [Lentzea flaviverrucosa]